MRPVRTLHTFLMLLGALSVLMLGAVPASAMAGGEVAPPCHETMAQTHGPDSDSHDGKAMTAMACCVSCVVAPALQPPVRGTGVHPALPVSPPPATLPAGLTPAPEHGPPRA